VLVDIIDEASRQDAALRIAVPTEGAGGSDAIRSGHFGHAASFTLVDIADGAIVATSVLENGPHDQGACGSIVDRLAAAGVGVVIAGGMGGGPRAGFAAAGIPVFFDPESPTPRRAVQAYLDGSVETFGDDHQCRGH
jgi:predicted Fe-Mo cluster-binding NifX family protein